MDIYIVYRTTNLVNQKQYYGVHKTQMLEDGSIPFDGYLGSGKYLKRAVKKYGEDKFIREVLVEFDNADDAFSFEKELVTDEIVKSNQFYNIKVGGEGGFNQDLMKQGLFENHGVFHPSQIEGFSEQCKATCLERYGVDHAAKTDWFKKKQQETSLETYGVPHWLSLEETKDKKKQTNLEIYGYENASQAPETIEKMIQTHIERYGDYYNRTEEGRQRLSDSWTPERKQEQSERAIEWHKNNENPAKRPEVRKLIGLSSLGRRGYWRDHPSPLKGTKRPPRTKEWCENISIAKRGKKQKPRSKESCINIGSANIGKNTGTTTALDLETGEVKRIPTDLFHSNRERYIGTGSKQYKEYKQSQQTLH